MIPCPGRRPRTARSHPPMRDERAKLTPLAHSPDLHESRATTIRVLFVRQQERFVRVGVGRSPRAENRRPPAHLARARTPAGARRGSPACATACRCDASPARPATGSAARRTGELRVHLCAEPGSWRKRVDGFFSKLVRSVPRHIPVVAGYEREERTLAAIDDIDQHPLVHPRPTSPTMPLDMNPNESNLGNLKPGGRTGLPKGAGAHSPVPRSSAPFDAKLTSGPLRLRRPQLGRD